MPRQLIGISMEWVGETPNMLAARYRKFARTIDDMRPFYERVIREAVQPMIIRHFEQGHVDGQFYASLADQTLWTKARYNYPTTILIRTRKWMRNASARVVWAVTKHDCRLVPSRLRPYGIAHETGAPDAHLPQRPVFVWDTQFYVDYERMLNQWVQELIDSA